MSEPDPQHTATNAVLAGCLTRLGWSPEQFAYHLNRMGRSLRPGGAADPSEDASAVADRAPTGDAAVRAS